MHDRDKLILVAAAGVVAGFLASRLSSSRARDVVVHTVKASVGTGGRSGIGQQLPTVAKRVHGSCLYLDYNATTPIFPEVTEAMLPFAGDHFGNPSSGHAFGRPCKEAVVLARQQLATLLQCHPDEIIFTSCGSESDNHAIRGAVEIARTRLPRGLTPHVITSNIEHPAVEECLRAMQDKGEIDVTPLQADSEGCVTASQVQFAITDATVLVTVMHSNNEIGSLQPIGEIADVCAKKKILLHTDAAQSIGKVPVRVPEIGADLMTIVGHKFGAPKGIACLYVKRGIRLPNFLFGGGQEQGRRAGTENVLLIAGIGKAAEIVAGELDGLAEHMWAMRTKLLERLRGAFGSRVTVNGPADRPRVLPNTLSVSIEGVKASELLAALGDKVAASAGAACHSGGATVSAVLRAIQLPSNLAVGTLRLSVGRHTTPEEIDQCADAIIEEAKRQLGQR